MPWVRAARGGRQRLCSRPCCGGGSQLGTGRLVLSKRPLFSACGFGKKNSGRAGQRHETCPCCLWLGFRLPRAPPRLCSAPPSLSTQLQLSVRVLLPHSSPVFLSHILLIAGKVSGRSGAPPATDQRYTGMFSQSPGFSSLGL